MGSVLVTYKVFPEDIVPSFDDLKAKIKGILPEFAAIERYGEEPVAFGLVALLVQIKYPEDKSGLVDEFEEKLAKIPGVSQAQTFQVRRLSPFTPNTLVLYVLESRISYTLKFI